MLWILQFMCNHMTSRGAIFIHKHKWQFLPSCFACSVLYSAVQSETAVYSVCRRVHLPSQHSKCSISFISQSGETMWWHAKQIFNHITSQAYSVKWILYTLVALAAQGCSAGWKKNIWFMNPGFTEPFVPTPLNFVFSTITGVRLFYRCTVHLNFMNPNPWFPLSHAEF